MANKPLKIAPSILSADFSRLGEEVAAASAAGADYIHVDVMDGHFVPPITIGAAMVEAIRRWSDVPLDVHLMVENPEAQIEQFAAAGADIITVHVEACPRPLCLIQDIKSRGIKAGISLNPDTPINAVTGLLADVDLVLVMTVNPGYAGQAFIESTLDKISALRNEIDRGGLKAELEVDGGINLDTAPRVAAVGAEVLVAGAAVFSSGSTVADSVAGLRASVEGYKP